MMATASAWSIEDVTTSAEHVTTSALGPDHVSQMILYTITYRHDCTTCKKALHAGGFLKTHMGDHFIAMGCEIGRASGGFVMVMAGDMLIRRGKALILVEEARQALFESWLLDNVYALRL